MPPTPPPHLPVRINRTARDALTPRDLAFVVHYCGTFAAEKSAIAAGIPPKGARTQATRLLKRVEIQAALREEADERLYDVQVNEQRVLHEVAVMAFSDIADYLRFTVEGDVYVDLVNLRKPELTRAIQEITVEEYKVGRGKDARDVRRTKLKLHGKFGPNEFLAKYLRIMPAEQHEHVGADGGPIVVEHRRAEAEREILDGLDRERARRDAAEVEAPAGITDADFEEVDP